MAFSDLCHISNAYKTVENDTDQSERIMEENSIVRDLITKILDDGGPTDISSSIPPPDKTLNGLQTNGHYPKNDTGTYVPPYNNYQNPLSNFNFGQNDQNGYNYNMPNGFGNGFVNYPDNDVNTLLGLDLPDTTDTVTPEQLNLLRLAAQQIGGAQFQSPKYDYNFFEPNQRNSLPETNMFPPNNFNRPNSLNLDMNYNNYDNHFNQNNQRFNNFKDSQDPSEILSYLSQLNMQDRTQEDFKMPLDLNGHYQNEELKMLEDRNKMYSQYNRNFNQPNKNFDNQFFDMMGQERSPLNQMNFDYSNQSNPATNNNFKPNGYHQNEFMQRRDMNPMMHREFPNEQRANFDNSTRDNMQQMALMRQNQELARQMSLLMRNRPPPNQLNVDVSFLHENSPYNLGLGALLGPSPPVPPPVLPSPMLDMPLLAPFYAMRNMRNAVTSSGILHARLDACYEQWRQLERERKRTEARLALAYPGRAVSSSNSIPVPRLPPCPSRVDRLTVDMLREHTKVLTLMGKMETLRASVCVAQNKRPTKPDENKITVLKRGQENVACDKDGLDPAAFDPSSWREDVKHLAEIAPHKEVESAMLSWRNAVTGVQAARKREMHPSHHARNNANDPILHLAEAVKQLCISARNARTAMWCDLTLTVALAHTVNSEPVQPAAQATPIKLATPDTTVSALNVATNGAKPSDAKEEKPTTETPSTKTETPTTSTTTAGANTTKNGAAKQTDKDKNHQQRRTQNYKKLNQRNDFYRNQRYDSRFMQNRHPYHYLATGPIN